MEALHGTRRAAIGAAALMAAGASSVSHPALARTGPCAPARIAASPSDAAWRDALDALARATGPGRLPWSCAGGSVELTLDPSGGALLTVADEAGRRTSRHVATPDEVVPTGEALLSSPLEPSPLVPTAPVAPPAAPRADEHAREIPKAPPPNRDPRVRIALAIGPRVSGPGATAWGSGQLIVDLPIGPWAIDFWTRYDVHLAGPSGPWQNFRESAVSAAVGVSRRIISHPFELRANLSTSVAVVMMEAGYENMIHPEGAKPALRIGSRLEALFPIAGIFRGLVGLDGEFAPAAITGLHDIDTVNHPPQLPPVPAYAAGLLVGAEATIP